MRNTIDETKSLYRELTVWLVALVCLVSVAVNLFNYLYFERQTQTLYQSKLSEYSVNLREQLEWPLWNVDDELIAKVGRAYASNAEIVSLTVQDDQHHIVYRYDNGDKNQIRREFSIQHAGQNIGNVQIGLSQRAYQDSERRLLLSSLLTTLLLIVALLAAMRWVLSRLLRRPVEALVGAIGGVVEGEYRQIGQQQTYLEFAPILSSFKSMTDAVASREHSLQQINQHLAVEIDERRRAEDALRINEERLKLATSAGRIGIWDWDVAGDVLTWDDSMYALYGITRDDFGGAYQAWVATLHPDDRAFADAQIQAALRGEREYAPEFRIVHPDGSVHNIKASSKTYFDDEGKPVRMIGINFDITALKHIEDELRRYKDHLEEQVQERTADLVLARDAAEAANRAKSVFLSSMSHELRTPLNAILGFSNMMRRDEQLTHEQRGNLDIINRSGEHLLTLINDVLEMAKIEAGRVQMENAPLDLGALVRDVTDMMQMRAKEKGLQLLIDQSSEFPRYIRGDEARLRQVLINLVGNAVKFTRQGGVTVRFGLKPNATPQRLLIEVEDTGVGIASADREKIFEPFVQVGEPSVQKGTGLGLTITRQFVQLMGGNITLDSTPDVGSVFRVELPIETVDAADIVRKDQTLSGDITGLVPGQPAYRILIVEDQLENQLLLKKLMENIGLQVRIANDGEQALLLFSEWRPHLIWMDRRMPVMDGLEATRRIRALPDGQEVKIVAVTASAFSEQRDEMLAAGMNEFVRKPYRFNEIYECLTRQLGLKYTYASTASAVSAQIAGDEEPGVEQLPALPDALRAALIDALQSLDSERIGQEIGKVEQCDGKLYRMLYRLAEDFDYPAILKILQYNETGNAI